MTLAAEILADTPLGFWLLDETSGTTAVDSSGNARHGTYTDATMVGTGPAPCGVGGVTPTFASGKYVTAPSDAAWSLGTTLTVEALVRREVGCDPVAPIVSHDPPLSVSFPVSDAGADDCYNVYAFENGVEIESNNRFPFLDGLLACNYDGKWAHVVVTKNGTGSTATNIYIDGRLIASGPCADFETGVRGLFLGRRGYPDDHILTGNLSHVAIYGTALSYARVQTHWRQIPGCLRLCGKPWTSGWQRTT